MSDPSPYPKSTINTNIMTKSKARPEVMSDFEYDLKREFDFINENKRAGNMVRIPDLYHEMKDQYSKEEFQQKLLELEKERVIELQAASDQKVIPETERDIGISHQSRGHLNYVVWRKLDTIPPTKANIQAEGTSQVKSGIKKNFSKREVLENQTVEILGRGRATQKVKARVVPKGKQPYHWEIVIPNKTPSKDLTKRDKIIITEKSEVEKVLKSLNTDYTIHNLGGNPFGSVQRTDVKQNPDGVRRSKKRIIFRQDKAFATFYYPVVNEKAEVVIIADEDYLGQYLSENLAHILPTEDITIYNVESTSPELLAEVLAKKHPQYNHNVNKAIAGSWYVESQSEVGATITSALTGKNSTLDNFTREQRGNQTWSAYKKVYLQGTQGINISDQELAVMGKVFEE
ncbi:MAG: hypothetical protein ACFE9L_08645 [Candidatus Hodarchaeota archaeon]